MPDFGRWSPGGGDPSLDEINRADRFFEALAAKQPVYPTDSAEAELANLFAELRDEVRDAPVTAPVSHHDAVQALDGGRGKGRGPRRSFAIVGSVAAAMLCIGGFGTAVYGAGPGDSLYGMRTAIFGQSEATRDDQVSLASAQLQQVQQLIDQGQWEQAQDKLVEVSSAVQDVDQVESKQQLVEQWNALTYKVVEQNPAATLPPGEPLPVLPSSPLTWLPMPVVEAPTSESTSPESTTSESTTDSTSTSESAITSSPSDTSVPPEVLVTPPSDASTTAPPASTSPPSTTTTVAPTATTTVAPTATTTVAPSTAVTTTTTTLPPRAPEATSPTSTVAEPPASQPRVAQSSTAASPPSVAAPSSAAVTPTQASPPATTVASQRPSAVPATTTVLVEPGGGS